MKTSPTAEPTDYLQPASGGRFTEDSLLLARFLPEELDGRAADFGAGCGVVGLEALALGRLKGVKELFFVEAQAIFQSCLALNVERAAQRAGDRRPDAPALRILEADWRALRPASFSGRLDLLAANPPYFPADASGPTRANRLGFRHETLGSLADLTLAAARLLAPGGRLCLSWPRRRLSVLTTAAAVAGLTAARFHLPPRAGATLILAEYVRPGR
ncbi:MAG: hypothetical protein LBU12_00195 [Deltaproteobacteria bacterium]|jgi:tRNA1Val (adenine37-N6)-methyltransferase|nr:hypothetical protein [Deltaproteobacteria bacterium]